MAQADFGMPPIGTAGRKPKTSIYTVMLILSLMALLIGMLFLYLEIRRFGGFGTVSGRVSALEKSTPKAIVVAQHHSVVRIPLVV